MNKTKKTVKSKTVKQHKCLTCGMQQGGCGCSRQIEQTGGCGCGIQHGGKCDIQQGGFINIKESSVPKSLQLAKKNLHNILKKKKEKK